MTKGRCQTYLNVLDLEASAVARPRLGRKRSVVWLLVRRRPDYLTCLRFYILAFDERHGAALCFDAASATELEHLC